jgi:16S rRNA processing protein RimM
MPKRQRKPRNPRNPRKPRQSPRRKSRKSSRVAGLLEARVNGFRNDGPSCRRKGAACARDEGPAPGASRNGRPGASAGWSAKGWRLGFAEIGDREAAESYAGCILELDEEELPALEENEFFLHDLVGLDVQDAEGSVGRVDWVFDRPGQPVLVVVDDRGDRKTERLIPFSAAIIQSVDIEAGIVRIDPPPGLLDL